MNSWVKISLGLALALWLACGAGLASRMQLVFDYSTLPLVPPQYEVLACSSGALGALAVLASAIGWLLVRAAKTRGSNVRAQRPASAYRDYLCVAAILVSCLPLLLIAMRGMGTFATPPHWWELVWFAAWTGVALRIGCPPSPLPLANQRWLWSGALAISAVAIAVWWYLQSMAYYADHQLGFNDFGHFAQRLSNTVNGNGVLRESPVLPPFWDHFNPGLLLLVPLWRIAPRIEWVFALQALCLAGSALLVAAIASARKQSPAAAWSWGCAWLMFPSIGQMNLAYTYGWHPITLAIPCLLAAYGCLCLGRWAIALGLALLGASFEEGVLVAVACVAVANAIRAGWEHRIPREDRSQDTPTQIASPISSRAWWIVAVAASVAFLCVYRFSGLAPFQTGRFARLGSNVAEIAMSPVLRPQVFWGLLFRERNLALACLVLVPFAVAATRAWLWSLLAAGPPMLVLMIWEHMPAQSIAFQYTSCLLPILFAGAIEQPAADARPVEPRALALLAIGWILSIAVGQMPWSNESLADVKARTYGVDARWNRARGNEDAAKIELWIEALRLAAPIAGAAKLPEWNRLGVLATGRIAAHCVGAGDVETVGQFWQRYDALKQLDPTLASPVLRYDVLLLDLQESFQQSPEETRRVMDEAEKHGLVVREQKYGLVLLTR